MNDIAHENTEIVLETLQKDIERIYLDAEKTAIKIIQKFTDSKKGYDVKLSESYSAGEISAREYRSRRRRNFFSGGWEDVIGSVARLYTDCRATASEIISGYIPGIFAENAAQTEYCISVLSGIDLNGGVYEEKDAKENKLFHLPSVERQKDLRWNKKRIEAEISFMLVRNRAFSELHLALRDVTNSAISSVMGTARAFITGAENGGRQYVLDIAASTGIALSKTWRATFDHRVRYSHKHAEGQTVPIDSPFTVSGEYLMYPGDPSGSAKNTKNCRCRMVISQGWIDIGEWDAEDYSKWLKERRKK